LEYLFSQNVLGWATSPHPCNFPQVLMGILRKTTGATDGADIVDHPRPITAPSLVLVPMTWLWCYPGTCCKPWNGACILTQKYDTDHSCVHTSTNPAPWATICQEDSHQCHTRPWLQSYILSWLNCFQFETPWSDTNVTLCLTNNREFPMTPFFRHQCITCTWHCKPNLLAPWFSPTTLSTVW